MRRGNIKRNQRLTFLAVHQVVSVILFVAGLTGESLCLGLGTAWTFAGFFKKSAAAYFVDNVKNAAAGTRTPPDWWRDMRKAERQQFWSKK